MATYYVTKQGDDAHAGTGPEPANAWLTIGEAVSNVAAGDTVYIGPGIYRETLTLATAGTSGSRISWRGDPDGRYCTSETPGRVRITGADSDELEGATDVISENGQAYNDWYDLYIDGSSVAAISGATANAGRLYRCVLSAGDTAVYRIAETHECVIIAGYYGVSLGTHYNDVFIGGVNGVSGGTAYNCIAIGSEKGFSFSTCYNCTALGSSQGFEYGGAVYNCLASGCDYGFKGTNQTWVNNVAVYCTYGFYGDSSTNKMDTSTAKAFACKTVQRGATTYETHTVGATSAVGWDYRKMIELQRKLEPYLTSGIKEIGSATYAPADDCLGRPRPDGAGADDVGAWEWCDARTSFTAGDYYTNPPAIVIYRGGEFIMQLGLKEGQNLTVQVRSKHKDLGGGASKPQLILRGKHITTQTDTNVTADDTWDLLTCTTGAVPVDCVIDVVFKGQDAATAAAKQYFSDIATIVG